MIDNDNSGLVTPHTGVYGSYQLPASLGGSASTEMGQVYGAHLLGGSAPLTGVQPKPINSLLRRIGSLFGGKPGAR